MNSYSFQTAIKGILRTRPVWPRVFNASGQRFLSSFKDPYSVLGIKNDANSNEIKRAYFELVKKYHPDTNKDPEAKTKFIEIQNAYEILSDPKRKAMFDQYGATEEQVDGAGGPSTGFGGGAGFDPSELFKNIFGAGASGSGGSSGRFGGFDIFGNGGDLFNQPEVDVTVSLHLSFLEAAKGAIKTVSFNRLEPCTPCGGRGVARGGKMTVCRTCRGSGQETRTRGSFLLSTTCRACGGLGQINPDPCTNCGGVGSARQSTTLQIQVPSGVAEGEAMSIRGEGNRLGKSVGDLIVSFTIEKSDIFQRKRNDIYVTVPLSLPIALLGGAITVPTIDGNVELKVNSGTQPDDVKRLSGRGIFNATTRDQGHQYVKFKIEIPRTLTREQQELLEACFNPKSSGRRNYSSGTGNKVDKSASPTPASESTSAPESGSGSPSPSHPESSTSPKQKPIAQWFDRFRQWFRWY